MTSHPFTYGPGATLDDAFDTLRHALRHATLPADEWEPTEEAWEEIAGQLGYQVSGDPMHLHPTARTSPSLTTTSSGYEGWKGKP